MPAGARRVAAPCSPRSRCLAKGILQHRQQVPGALVIVEPVEGDVQEDAGNANLASHQSHSRKQGINHEQIRTNSFDELDYLRLVAVDDSQLVCYQMSDRHVALKCRVLPGVERICGLVPLRKRLLEDRYELKPL